MEGLILTHGHYDHTGAVYAVHEETGAPVYMNALDAGTAVAFDSYTFTPPEGTIFYKEGDEVKVGNLTFRVMETPGHTPGGVTLICGDALFTGDTLFAGSCGRTDFAGGSMAAVAGQDRGSARRLRGLPRPHGLLHARDRAPLQSLPDRAAKPRTVKLHKGNRRDTNPPVFSLRKEPLRDKSPPHMVCFGRGERHARHWSQHPPRPHAPASDAGRSGAGRAHDAADHIELRNRGFT